MCGSSFLKRATASQMKASIQCAYNSIRETLRNAFSDVFRQIYDGTRRTNGWADGERNKTSLHGEIRRFSEETQIEVSTVKQSLYFRQSFRVQAYLHTIARLFEIEIALGDEWSESLLNAFLLVFRNTREDMFNRSMFPSNTASTEEAVEDMKSMSVHAKGRVNEVQELLVVISGRVSVSE
jgi:hypothetical protein